MYNVSDDYITAVRANTRKDTLFGTITFSDGTVQQITDADIGEGSVSIEWQCVDGEELEFGSAILTELNIDIRTEQNRYAFYGAKISLTYSVKIGIDEDEQEVWEDVPLGIYSVSEATRVGNLVSIKAYDNLQKLDIAYGDATIVGTPYEILDEVCDKTGLELGIESSDISSWPNADQIVQIDSSTGCNTFREAVKIVCQMICAFATVDRTGKLVVRQFHTDVDITLTKGDRYSSSVADYVCTYSGVSVTGLSGTYESVSRTVDNGLLLVMNDAPAWDYGVEEVLQGRVDEILAYLETLEYSPSDVSMPGDPSIECGDKITLTYDDEELDTIITGVSWSYRNSMSIESIGKNPYFSTSTSVAQATNRILTQTSENNKLVLYNYTNIEDVIINDGSTQSICDFRFASTGATTVLFYASVKLEVTANEGSGLTVTTNASFVDDNNNIVPITGTVDGSGFVDIKFIYNFNGMDLEYTPEEHLLEGIHTIVLFYPIEGVTAQSVNFWKVSLLSSNGDTTILEHDLKAVLLGQNLVATVPWDGTINVVEFVNQFVNITPITALNNVASDIDISRTAVTYENFEDYVNNAVTLTPITVIKNVKDVLTISRVFQKTILSTFYADDYEYSRRHVSTITGVFKLNTDYRYASEAESIDEGTMQVLTIDKSEFSDISEIEVTSD